MMTSSNMPTTEELKQAIEAAGDGCGICDRSQLWNGETTTTGLFRGKIRCVGECCSNRLNTIYGVGMYYGGPDRPWITDDREWFALHTNRTHRFRRSFPDEKVHSFEPSLSKNGTVNGRHSLVGDFIVVIQVEPGARRRVPLSVEGFEDIFNKVLELPDAIQEAFAHVLANRFLTNDGTFTSADRVPIQELLNDTIAMLRVSTRN